VEKEIRDCSGYYSYNVYFYSNLKTMRISKLSANAVAALAACTLLFSCSASRYSNGFAYRSNDPGIDIGSGNYRAPVPDPVQSAQNSRKADAIEKLKAEDVQQYLENQHVALSENDKEKINTITSMVKEEYHKQKASGQMGPATKDIVRNVTTQLQEKGMISELSDKKLHRIEKLSNKLDKKMQKHSGFLGEGIDLFFAILAIAGLAIALIFGAWIGLLMFIVFGAIWLYRRLVSR
jgi:hypothetical protein